MREFIFMAIAAVLASVGGYFFGKVLQKRRAAEGASLDREIHNREIRELERLSDEDPFVQQMRSDGKAPGAGSEPEEVTSIGLREALDMTFGDSLDGNVNVFAPREPETVDEPDEGYRRSGPSRLTIMPYPGEITPREIGEARAADLLDRAERMTMADINWDEVERRRVEAEARAANAQGRLTPAQKADYDEFIATLPTRTPMKIDEAEALRRVVVPNGVMKSAMAEFDLNAGLLQKRLEHEAVVAFVDWPQTPASEFRPQSRSAIDDVVRSLGEASVLAQRLADLTAKPER